MNPLLLVDFYKPHHAAMYPTGMTKLYSNLTPRKSRMVGVDGVVVFGIQHFALEYLIEGFNKNFFQRNKEEVINEYKRHIPIDTTGIEKLWDLGYLPLEIKALEEGTICPIGVPCLTITNTHSEFAWLVNYLETLISCELWQPITSATIAHQYKKLLTKYAVETTGNADGVQWQGHDFSMRGMSSKESAILSGMAHLLSFTGTDTIPAIYQLEKSYNAKGLIGASVPATEHSVMCMGQKESEIETFERLLDLYPTGILSVVSDTWDLWKVCTEYLPQLKEKILSRDGKLVIRPDSGDPVDIICGKNSAIDFDLLMEEYYGGDLEKEIIFRDKSKYYKFIPSNYRGLLEEYGEQVSEILTNKDNFKQAIDNGVIEKIKISDNEQKGVIELLWDIFGGTINEQGYKVLDPHIGAIYGDSITLERAEQICERLKAKGFASTNIVLGIGSFTYQYNTRDTFGFAMKATYGEVKEYDSAPGSNGAFKIEYREIFKDPITDDGTKRSKKGLLRVTYEECEPMDTYIVVDDQCTWAEENTGLLTTVFKNSKLTRTTTLDEIRNKLV